MTQESIRLFGPKSKCFGPLFCPCPKTEKDKFNPLPSPGRSGRRRFHAHLSTPRRPEMSKLATLRTKEHYCRNCNKLVEAGVDTCGKMAGLDDCFSERQLSPADEELIRACKGIEDRLIVLASKRPSQSVDRAHTELLGSAKTVVLLWLPSRPLLPPRPLRLRCSKHALLLLRLLLFLILSTRL